MLNRVIKFLIPLWVLMVSHYVNAGQNQLSVDFDGDGVLETIEIQKSKYMDPEIDAEGSVLKIIHKGYSADEVYYPPDDDEPALQLVSLDEKRRIVLVETLRSAGPTYKLYTFRDGVGFIKLFEHFGGLPGLRTKPDFSNPGIISLVLWQGFWNKRVHYKYDDKLKTFALINELLFSVNVKAVLEKDIKVDLTGEKDGGTFESQAGKAIEIVLFDSEKSRYLVRDISGVLAWIREDDLENFKDLPYSD